MQLPLPTSDQALPGRDIPIQVSEIHFVNGNLIKPPFENEIEFADFAFLVHACEPQFVVCI